MLLKSWYGRYYNFLRTNITAYAVVLYDFPPTAIIDHVAPQVHYICGGLMTTINPSNSSSGNWLDYDTFTTLLIEEEAVFGTELLSLIRKSRRSLAPPLLDDVLWWLSVWKSITALTIQSSPDRHSPIILHLEWEVPLHPLIQPSSGGGSGNNGPSTSHAVHTKRSIQHVHLVNGRLIDGSPVAHYRHTSTNTADIKNVEWLSYLLDHYSKDVPSSEVASV